jgi:hypothetical protein
MELSGKTNISPKIWGSYFWKTFHLSTFGYPKEPNDLDKETYKTFYITFMKILPCDGCSIKSQKIINEKSIINDELINGLESRDALIKWGYNFHKMVNDSLGVKSPELEEFIKDITLLISGKRKINYLFIGILILLLFIAIFMRCTFRSP